MANKRVGILTGGGDVPGLNSVIKSVVYRGAEIGCDVIGIRRGWEGLTHVDLNDPTSKARYVLPLNRENTHHRPHGRNVSAQLAHESREDEEAASGFARAEI
jgi:6-phosphofructokinase